jgi:hypothetical protein
MKMLNVAVKGALFAVPLLLCACATTTTSSQRMHARAVPPSPAAVDVQKMAIVDYIARRKGVEVVWVNPPQAPRND